MARGHWHPAQCRGCDKRRADGHHISQTGLCTGCSGERVGENIEQMVRRSGPNFSRWRARMAASVGAALLDDGGSSPHTASDA